MTDWAAAVWQAVAGGRATASGEVRGRCPFCLLETGKEDRKKSLSFNMRSGLYYCHKCGSSGHVDVAPLDVAGNPVDRRAVKLEPPEGFVHLDSAEAERSLALEPAFEFVRSRRIEPYQLFWGSVGACAVGRFGGRVVIPLLVNGDKWEGCIGRSWVKKAEKPYLYQTGMRRGEYLYNEDMFHFTSRPGPTGKEVEQAYEVDPDDPIIAVEGALDALYVGLWDAVAFLGKPSRTQLDKLVAATDCKGRKRPVCIALDGDTGRGGETGSHAADGGEGQDIARYLHLSGRRAGSLRLPPRVDPDEVPRAELLEAARRCIGQPEPVRL